MDRPQAMQVYSKVVELGSFFRAADALSLARGRVSVIVKKLEENLQSRLIQRTTRRLYLTPEGLKYCKHCIRILGDVADTEHSLAKRKSLRGRLHVHMPPSVGRSLVIPRNRDFRERFTGIDLAIGLVQECTTLVQGEVDCAITFGEVTDSSFVQLRLGELPIVTAASPEYIRHHGKPQRIDELKDHFAVQCFSNRTGRIASFKFDVNGVATEVHMRSALSVSDADAYVICGVIGAGVIQAPRFIMAPYLRSGALVEVLPEWKPLPMPLAAVYPRNRHHVSTVRHFIDWAAEQFKECAFAMGERAVSARQRRLEPARS